MEYLVVHINFFCSYLSDRSKDVDFNSQISTELPISTGVSQGSVLEPLLFLTYINKMYARRTRSFFRNKNAI